MAQIKKSFKLEPLPPHLADIVNRTYRDVQVLAHESSGSNYREMKPLSDNWKDKALPELQRRVVDIQLDHLKQGCADPVFISLLNALCEIDMDEFSLLDAGCATGYYCEVLSAAFGEAIRYSGCDYSSAMIEKAESYYPDNTFAVQDLTCLDYEEGCFDVVLLSGILEHIPDYELAIMHACRVADNYLIIHRCPLTPEPENENNISAQYNILTPRIAFSKKKILDEVLSRKFQLVREYDVYDGVKNIKTFLFKKK